jgi:dTDP-4-dehydrorhamnose 3,5-epimerase
VQIRELSVPDSFEITPRQQSDDRGTFFEWCRFDRLEERIGHALDLRQASTSISKRGVVRGIHFADIPPGQANYVTCNAGVVLDFVIDIRVGSETFGERDSVLLDATDRKAVYLSEGLGHAFVALTEGATVSYLVSDLFNASREHAITPLDDEIGSVFPKEAGPVLLPPKDLTAPTLAEAKAAVILSAFESSLALYPRLAQK